MKKIKKDSKKEKSNMPVENSENTINNEENKKTSLVQIQKNMIINIDKIYAITKNSILYEDGKEYEIGRVYKKDFKKKYEEYIYDN